MSEKVILFDGVCNLCNGAVNFIIDRDHKGVFKFASLQSPYGQEYLKRVNKPLDEFESLVLIDHGKDYSKSTAALKIAKELSGGWSLFYAFIILPGFLRDPLYSLIANNRYRWFGKRDECRIPTPELKAKFVD